MPYEHKTTRATIIPETNWYSITFFERETPSWAFGSADLERRSYDFSKGDRRFVSHVSDKEIGIAVVKYVNDRVTSDGKPRLLQVTRDGLEVTWTVIEP